MKKLKCEEWFLDGNKLESCDNEAEYLDPGCSIVGGVVCNKHKCKHCIKLDEQMIKEHFERQK